MRCTNLHGTNVRLGSPKICAPVVPRGNQRVHLMRGSAINKEIGKHHHGTLLLTGQEPAGSPLLWHNRRPFSPIEKVLRSCGQTAGAQNKRTRTRVAAAIWRCPKKLG